MSSLQQNKQLRLSNLTGKQFKSLRSMHTDAIAVWIKWSHLWNIHVFDKHFHQQWRIVEYSTNPMTLVFVCRNYNKWHFFSFPSFQGFFIIIIIFFFFINHWLLKIHLRGDILPVHCRYTYLLFESKGSLAVAVLICLHIHVNASQYIIYVRCKQLARLIISRRLSCSGCKNTWWSLPLPVRSASLKTFILIFSTSGLALHEGSAGFAFVVEIFVASGLLQRLIKMPNRLDTATFKTRNKKAIKKKKERIFFQRLCFTVKCGTKGNS